MFRQMRKIKQKISQEECIEILKNEPRGVLALHGEDGYPYAIPMNQYYDEEENKIYFHSAKVGHKLDAMKANDKVSFCIYDKGFRKEGEWPLNIKSVVIFGRIKPVDGMDITVEKVRKLSLKHYPDPESVEEEIEKSIKAVQLLELTIDHMTGKLVNES